MLCGDQFWRNPDKVHYELEAPAATDTCPIYADNHLYAGSILLAKFLHVLDPGYCNVFPPPPSASIISSRSAPR